ncbi:MAG: SAM-dependent methyltransferase [Verrucomicrobiales bacterium]|jgi:SAM-dependent methyltransferase
MKAELKMVQVECCICETSSSKVLGAGDDFEYHTTTDAFSVSRCEECDLVFLNPRPDTSEFATIYPTNYHAFDFSAEDFGLVHKIRSRLEARRILSWCRQLPDDARILDIGCGDGFHLDLLRKFGKKTWQLAGIDIDPRAVERARASNFAVHCGSIETLELKPDQFDLAIMVMTIEHVACPTVALEAAQRLLKPGGKLVVVTDNTDSIDFALFKHRHWGGYHFPRHWNLFNRQSFEKLAAKTGFEVVRLTTQVSPVNWVYSIHNRLVDHRRPQWLVNCFTLKSKLSLGAFTLLDIALGWIGRGALLNATIRKPLTTDDQ